MRNLAGLTPFNFTATPLPRDDIVASPVNDLRTALDAARSALGLSPVTYTDPTLTPGSTIVKAVHLTDLRGGVQ